MGGHNLLEPAALSKPCLIGSSFYNFKLITEQLVANNACIICPTIEDISTQLISLFESLALRETMGTAALNIVNKNQGALNKTLENIQHNFNREI